MCLVEMENDSVCFLSNSVSIKAFGGVATMANASGQRFSRRATQ